MQTAAVFVWDAGIGMAIMGVLAALLAKVTKHPFLSKLTMMFFALVVACVGGWAVLNACAQRSQGLGQTLGRTSQVVNIATHPVETQISFWLTVLVSSLFCIGGILAAMVVLIPDKDKQDECKEDNEAA